MKKQRIPWEKAPKRIYHLAHVFVGFHNKGYFIFWRKTTEGWISDCILSGIEKPKGLRWQDSFTPAPRKRK